MNSHVNKEYVVLVNEHDEQIGLMEKQQAHEEGRLHRAVSVFIYNNGGQMLLQKRAEAKYHSPGLWTNACCSHPREAEETKHAAIRRLYEEMEMACPLTHAFSFLYRAEVDRGLVENEYDHVFTGMTDAVPNPDPAEVAGYKYMYPADIKKDIEQNPDNYTTWFKICFRDHYDDLVNIK